MTDDPTKRLERAQLLALAEKLRAKGERDFFSQVPPELKRRWNIYQQNRVMRSKVGAPLPPGGVFILGDATVVAGCAAELHTSLANMTRLPHDSIRLKIAHDPVRVVADVEMPKDWMMPIEVPGQAPDLTEEQVAALFRKYLDGVMDLLNQKFREALHKRWHQNDDRRPELVPEVEPWSVREEAPN